MNSLIVRNAQRINEILKNSNSQRGILQHLEVEFRRAQAALKAGTEAEERMRSEIGTLRTELTELRGRVEVTVNADEEGGVVELREELERNNGEIRSLEGKIVKLKEGLELETGRLGEYEVMEKRVWAEIEDLEEQSIRSAEETKELRVEVGQLEEENDKTEEFVGDRRVEIQNRRIPVQELSECLKELQQEIADEEEKRPLLRESIEQLQKVHGKLTRAVASAKEAVSEIVGRIEVANAEQESASQELRDIKGEARARRVEFNSIVELHNSQCEEKAELRQRERLLTIQNGSMCSELANLSTRGLVKEQAVRSAKLSLAESVRSEHELAGALKEVLGRTELLGNESMNVRVAGARMKEVIAKLEAEIGSADAKHAHYMRKLLDEIDGIELSKQHNQEGLGKLAEVRGKIDRQSTLTEELRFDRDAVSRELDAFRSEDREMRFEYETLAAGVGKMIFDIDTFVAKLKETRRETTETLRAVRDLEKTLKRTVKGKHATDQAVHVLQEEMRSRTQVLEERDRTRQRQLRKLAQIKTECDGARDHLKQRTQKRESLEAELAQMESDRLKRECQFNRTINEIETLNVELQRHLGRNSKLTDKRERLRTLQLHELSIAHRLHVARVEARALYYESAHPVLVPSRVLMGSVDRERFTQLEYLRRLQSAFVESEQRLAKLVHTRDALLEAHSTMMDTLSQGLSQEEFSSRTRIFSEKLTQKNQELNAMREQLVMEEIAKQSAMAASARGTVSHRLLHAAALKRENIRLREIDPAFVTQSASIYDPGPDGVQLLEPRQMIAPGRSHHGYKVKPPPLPPLNLSGRDVLGVTGPCWSERPKEPYGRYPHITVPSGAPSARVGRKISARHAR
jgi:chromosome segregation ATPase